MHKMRYKVIGETTGTTSGRHEDRFHVGANLTAPNLNLFGSLTRSEIIQSESQMPATASAVLVVSFGSILLLCTAAKSPITLSRIREGKKRT